MRKRGCTARRIRADLLETLVETTLLADIGSQSLTEEETVPASDNSTAMAELAEAIGALASQIALARAHGHDTSDLEAQQQINESNLARLVHEPTRHAETIEHDTGETWAERWQRLDWNKRNSLLRRKGIKFWAERDDEGLPKVISTEQAPYEGIGTGSAERLRGRFRP
jgi:hypothetical protein